ncbi:NAD+ ADP-ribosyltransferase Parp [Handroanthus impetiginosus]|uniref:Poly [ADP-ribose] polymerase n=1 Tax=Handroanthus impetiginosus TaxID=429701 RepID=A0A2G9H0S3_9LAMI|nr:NAD+ ADP-ribosyltransferase Parp [Handroanthus impetiginosus]
MANPPKPWKAEYAKSSRSSCKTCKIPINKESLRLGKMVQATQFDGFMPMWNHAACILRKIKQIKSVDDVEGLELLRWEDQEKIRKYIDGAVSSNSSAPSVSSAPAVVECGVELSQTSRATCRSCNQKIVKGEIRISTKPEGQGARALAWHHAKCYMETSSNSQVEKFSGWDSLSDSDRTALLSLVKKNASTSKGTKVEHEDEKEPVHESTSKGGAKRKRAPESVQKSKIAKAGGNDSSNKSSASNTKNMEDENSKASSLESQLEMQTRTLWALKDDLKKYVTTSELREMLEANDQESRGSELDLRERCADGMLFGALEKCPMCSGSLHYSSGMYRCSGYLSEWTKCSYSTTEPRRVKGKWKIPEGTSNEYLLKWFKSQKVKKPERVLPPKSPCGTSGSQAASALSQSSKVENIGDLKVAITGVPNKSMEEWKNKIEGAGGQVHIKIKKETNCLVVIGVLDHNAAEVKKARRMKIPIVREDYLVDCIKRQKKLPFDMYRVETIENTHGVATVKVKGQSSVHEASGLQDSGHILEDGKSIYNTTLNMSDLSTGINSYYILQIIQDDKSSDCYVFRKWGRVGNEKIGGTKLEEMSKSDAIKEFKRLFLEKTGNSWEAWEQKKDFHKQPGRFYPLEIDYGVKDLSKKKQLNFTSSQLAPQLVELMKMLFNVEAYRAAMVEFEINLSEMPLGKLSKSNIQKGFEALTQIQNLLNSTAYAPNVKESLLVDASNRFFTVIPSIHPHIINDEDDFKLKVKMLEALQDIEIASRLVGFDADSDESIDEKYKKLRCHISPLSHDSEDFQLIEKYLHTTHAPTHTDWALELEEVFSLERAGEMDRYAPYRAKLNNKMLLWHDKGVLENGPILNEVFGYLTLYLDLKYGGFGKGVYFADLVSKSAQYCFTDRNNPVGLMLVSEVALGEVYELTKSQYMDKPPKGKHSTKGLGKTVPLESEFVKWRDDVVVPCGKPVPSKVKASELMYNEYIVYDTAQVKMQFLLKVRFHHKR